SRLSWSAKSSRAPTSTRCPASAPATCARTTPASELRSAMPIAAWPSSLDASTSSCGCEPPRRKLELVVVCSSTYAGMGWTSGPVKQSRVTTGDGLPSRLWIASSLALLAMTMTVRIHDLACKCRGNSGKQAVEVPARRGRGGLGGVVEPVAIDPEARAVAVLDPVIVAGRAVAPPPFGGDALGPLGAAHLVRAAAPAELARRIVGHQRDRLDRLGPRQQARRPRRRGLERLGRRGRGFRGWLLRRRVEKRQQDPGALRQRAGARRRPGHAGAAEPVGQPVEQRRD